MNRRHWLASLFGCLMGASLPRPRHKIRVNLSPLTRADLLAYAEASRRLLQAKYEARKHDAA